MLFTRIKTQYRKNKNVIILKSIFFLFLLFIFLSDISAMGNNQSSSYFRKEIFEWHQTKWCYDHGGLMELIPSANKKHYICLTKTHAVEFAFSNEFREVIGNALYASYQHGKKAGIVLFPESDENSKDLEELDALIQYFKLPVDTWILKEGSE